MAEDDGDRGKGRLLLRVWNDTEAALVRQILDEHGIPCQVVSDIPHTLFPLTVDGLGEVRIFVPEERHEEAAAILAEHRRQGFEVLEDGAEDEEAG